MGLYIDEADDIIALASALKSYEKVLKKIRNDSIRCHPEQTFRKLKKDEMEALEDTLSRITLLRHKVEVSTL